MSLADIMACTRGMNTNTNGGVRYKYGNEYIIRGITSTNDVEKLGTCIVKKNGESVVTLADVADIKIGNQSPKLGVASERAQSAVLLTVTKQPNTSTIDLTKHLDLALDDLKQTLPSDVHISTDIFRQADFIESSIDNVQKSLIEGAIFVVIILMIFLANVRTTVISLVTIPISFLRGDDSAQRPRHKHQHHDPRRTCHCHRLARRRCHRRRGERVQAHTPEPVRCPRQSECPLSNSCTTLRARYVCLSSTPR